MEDLFFLNERKRNEEEDEKKEKKTEAGEKSQKTRLDWLPNQ